MKPRKAHSEMQFCAAYVQFIPEDQLVESIVGGRRWAIFWSVVILCCSVDYSRNPFVMCKLVQRFRIFSFFNPLFYEWLDVRLHEGTGAGTECTVGIVVERRVIPLIPVQ